MTDHELIYLVCAAGAYASQGHAKQIDVILKRAKHLAVAVTAEIERARATAAEAAKDRSDGTQ